MNLPMPKTQEEYERSMEIMNRSDERSREILSQRMALWREVAVAVSRAENSYEPSSPINWANKILDAFDAKFGLNQK